MPDRRVICPHCRQTLRIPPRLASDSVRCGKCHEPFHLVKRRARDEEIATWLMVQERAPTPMDERVIQAVRASAVGEKDVPRPKQIRIVRLNAKGVLMEFPAERLREESFRSGLPRRCLRCGARVHLRAHVVIFAPRLKDSFSLSEEHRVGELVLSDREVVMLSTDQLLKRFSRVPNVPHPADLPMPYYICNSCSGVGQISGQYESSGEGDGTCRLWLAKLKRAEDFLVHVDGDDCPALQRVRKQIREAAENPWQRLAEVERHRLEQWVRTAPNEQFLAYIPDRTHQSNERGMTGLVVTTKRLICHSHRRHHETKLADSIVVRSVSAGRQVDLWIRCPQWETKCCLADRDGMDRLRRALARSGCRVKWI